jgi:hypothetical protein
MPAYEQNLTLMIVSCRHGTRIVVSAMALHIEFNIII